MASITITFNDSLNTRVLNAICGAYGYQATLPGGADNPESRAQFARRVVRDLVKDIIVRYEEQAASVQAGATARTSATSEIELT